MKQRTWTFLRRHRARTTIYKTLLSNEAEVYKNFILVKSDLQLNLQCGNKTKRNKETESSKQPSNSVKLF